MTPNKRNRPGGDTRGGSDATSMEMVTADRSRPMVVDVALAERRMQEARKTYVIECCRAAAQILANPAVDSEMPLESRIAYAISELRAAENELMAGALR